MSIEKRIVPINFTCTPEDIEDISYDITYYPNSDDKFNIEIFFKNEDGIVKSDGSDSFKYPVSLFVEIVDFLREEKLIKNKDINKSIGNHKDIDVKIENKDGVDSVLPIPKIHPIFSFDTANGEGDLFENENNEESMIKEEMDKEEIVNNEEVKNKESKDDKENKGIIKRPVIRSRVTDDENDPLGAERDAHIQRSKIMKNNNKTIKRKEEE